MSFKSVIILLWVLISSGLYGQCETCEPINDNGDFELTHYVPGAENIMGISMGKIQAWYGTHGTSDFFDSNWNWYGAKGIENNAGHICYGNRPSHDHSEGIYTEVNILPDDDLNYCITFDYASFCESEKPGKLHIYFANNLTQGPSYEFSFPTDESHPEWFEASERIDLLEIVEESSFEKYGWSNYSIDIKPTNQYKQLWLFTEYLYDDNINVNCGIMFDNVEVKCMTDALTDISVISQADGVYLLGYDTYKNIQVVQHEWYINGMLVSNNETFEFNFDSSYYEIELRIKDERGACGTITKSFRPNDQPEENRKCDYAICLDSPGIPQIEQLLIIKDEQEHLLNSNTEGFNFPYCAGEWSTCDEQGMSLFDFMNDLQSWLNINETSAQVLLGDDNSLGDGCRSNLLRIEGSTLELVYLDLSDQKSSNTQRLYFYSTDCYDASSVSSTYNHELTIGPSPTQDIINVSFDKEYEELELSLLDCTGNVLFQKTLLDTQKGDSETIPLNQYQSGIYFVHINSSHRAESYRIIKA